VSKIKK
jgi:hypothetical protein